MQWFASGTNELHLMTDVVSGVFSVICTALFLRFVWHPKTRFLLRDEREALAKSGHAAAVTTDTTTWTYRYTAAQTIYAWMPWIILVACCALWGAPAFKTFLNNLFSNVTFSTTLLGSKFAGSLSLPAWDMSADEAAIHDFSIGLHRDRAVSDPVWADVVGRFGEQGAVDLIGLCGYYAFLSMVMNGARTPAPPSSAAPLRDIEARRP